MRLDKQLIIERIVKTNDPIIDSDRLFDSINDVVRDQKKKVWCYPDGYFEAAYDAPTNPERGVAFLFWDPDKDDITGILMNKIFLPLAKEVLFTEYVD